jgi:hypothetical protein
MRAPERSTRPSRRGRAGALLFSNGPEAHVVCGGALFALGAAGVGLQGWHAVKRLRGGPAGSRPRAVRRWPLCPVGPFAGQDM